MKRNSALYRIETRVGLVLTGMWVATFAPIRPVDPCDGLTRWRGCRTKARFAVRDVRLCPYHAAVAIQTGTVKVRA